MANIKSQIKRIKTNEKARLRNKAVKSSLKTPVRRVREAVADPATARPPPRPSRSRRQADKAVSKGVIHENQAANKKSAHGQAGCLALARTVRQARPTRIPARLNAHKECTGHRWHPLSVPTACVRPDHWSRLPFTISPCRWSRWLARAHRSGPRRRP